MSKESKPLVWTLCVIQDSPAKRTRTGFGIGSDS
jgi:hypothetical protein